MPHVSDHDFIEARKLVGEVTATLQVCQRCELVGVDVEKRPCMTAYADPGSNSDPILCEKCHGEYVAYWTAMWDEFYASQRL